ncbi:MAG: T9SS type A sorting domain-containing protein [candidate division Zixibacteria bacterium]|nr:T9SS type A sorting domain-containing protein [candidate division Zixibacteria bacterium]
MNLKGERLWLEDTLGLVIAGGEEGQKRDPGVWTDSTGYIYLTWNDITDDSLVGGIYAQKIDIEGNKYWDENGVKACYGFIGDLNRFYDATIDGNGGVFMSWYDRRFSSQANIYAAWVDSIGSTRWGLEGITITFDPNGGVWPLMEYDGHNGAYIGYPSGSGNQNVQWIKSGPAEEATQWEENGKPITVSVIGHPNSLFYAGNNEWIFSFKGEERQAFSQKFDTTGTCLWGERGKNVWPYEVSDYCAVTDNAGGAIVIANLFDTYYAQRIDSDGHYPGETGIVDDMENLIPGVCALHTPYPNPFNSSTQINFDIAANGHTSLTIYNLAGKEVTQLSNGFHKAGGYSVLWTGKTNNGGNLPSGVYFLCLKSGGRTYTKKITLIK